MVNKKHSSSNREQQDTVIRNHEEQGDLMRESNFRQWGRKVLCKEVTKSNPEE
jgi:hypothetical protein